MGKAKKKDVKKEKKKPEKSASKKKAAPREEEGLRGIIRLAGRDVMGHLPLKRALLRIKGIGYSTNSSVARMIAKEINVEPDVKVGLFSDEQIEKIDQILANLQDYGIPAHLMNRRKDRETGKDLHNIMNDLVFSQRQDIEAEKKLYTWRGYRHAYGQKVRGQRTKNTGRRGMSVGVVRKSQQPAEKKGKK
ncbi:MAG: 30S ribosomal protein S13 [Candidatus Micrarchaeia archaeon]